MQAIRDYYSELSQDYDVQRSNRYFQMIEELELGAVRRHLSVAGERVLELGCGTGIFLRHLQGSSFSLHGLDYTRGMLDVAQHKLCNPSIGLVHGDAQVLPYASNAFGVVYSFKVLAHLPHIDQALREIRRVLRPDGVAVLEFYNRHSIRHLLYRGGYFHQWHSPAEVRQLLEEAGFSVVGAYGARTVVPFARAMEVPLIGHILRRAESILTSTAFNRFAGYYIVAGRAQ